MARNGTAGVTERLCAGTREMAHSSREHLEEMHLEMIGGGGKVIDSE